MNSPPTFDLLEEPWIRVRDLEGRVFDLSLRGVLAKAHRLRGLAGELPTQDAAVLRLLLAVLLGATRPEFERSEEESLDLWAAWWRAGCLPMELLDRYLDPLRQRFDLLHPTTPFLQVAELKTVSGKRSGLGKLIADLPDGAPFFTTRAGRQLESLSLAEAARWLVHCQAFDPSGIKTGAAGDDRVKGGKGYPFGYPAWAGNLGLVMATGATLYETLLFNLPLTSSGPDDLPVWERLPNGPGVDVSHPEPRGPADVFTWPSRRLRLFTEGERVVDVQISNGDKLGPQNRHPVEPMAAWRWSKNQSKAGSDVLMPVTHDPTRRIWQGLGPLLLRANGNQQDRRAGVIDWLGTLRHYGELPASHPVDLWVVGLEYGNQNATIAGAIDDRLAAPIAVLTDPVLTRAAVDAASWAKDGVVALVNLASNLDRAAGGDGSAGREEAFERGYTRLDQPFRRWISHLTNPEELQSVKDEWALTASQVLRSEGGALVHDAGPVAIIGRQVPRQGTDQMMLLDAGIASIWFRSTIAKVFPVPERQEVLT